MARLVSFCVPGLTSLLPQHNHLVSLHAINRFEIAKSFELEATYDEIALSCGLSEFDVRRLLRTAMTYHIFHEPRPGVVAHTAASKFLAVAPGMDDSIALITEENWTSASKVRKHSIVLPHLSDRAIRLSTLWSSGLVHRSQIKLGSSLQMVPQSPFSLASQRIRLELRDSPMPWRTLPRTQGSRPSISAKTILGLNWGLQQSLT